MISRVMTSKQNIKDAISLLCKIINHHGASKLNPETFRLAKFDKDEATEPMWKLLFGTNHFLKCGSFQVAKDISKQHDRHIVFCSKLELLKKGYHSKDFFMLPEDMSSGSREILLAFGWLMSRAKLLRRFLENCSNLLEECSRLNEEPVKSFNLESSEKFGNYSQKSNPNLDPSDEFSNLNQLTWILGNLKLNCNGLYSAENHLVSLINRVHCATLGAENPKEHLSTLEVFMLRHPKEFAKFQGALERYNSYLGNLLKFVELQDVFWKWMESVLEAKLTENRDNEVEDWRSIMNHNCKTCWENADKQIKQVSQIQLLAQKVLDNGDSFYFKACEITQKNNHQSGNGLNEKDWSKLNNQMEIFNLKESSVVCRNMLETFPELKYSSSEGSTASNKIYTEPSCASKGIKLLKREICQLEVKLMEMRKLHFDILNDLTANLQELVCIPPIQASKYIEHQNK